MQRQRIRQWVPVAAWCAVLMMGAARAQAGDLELCPLFSDHAVLLADAPVPVWGWADPGATVSVTFAGQTQQATTNDAGRWQVTLDPMKSGEQGELKVAAPDGAALTSSDVVVGEVWLCSGQSNMEFYVVNLNDPDAERATADLPGLRLFKVEKEILPEPTDRLRGQWVVSNPKAVTHFSALGFLFGRDLHKQLQQPVGMIQSTWGGTRAMNWVSKEVLDADPDKYAESVAKNQERYDGAGAASFEEYKQLAKAHKADETQPNPGTVTLWTSRIYNGMIAPLFPCALRGILWYQGESDAYEAPPYRTLFPAMIESWREGFAQGDLPFIFVQLPGYKQPVDKQAMRVFWSELREAQAMALDLPNTTMVATTDIGEADIHPKNKEQLAPRVLNAALATVYGKDVAYRGPGVADVTFSGGAAHVKFAHVTGTLKLADDHDAPGHAFALAGKDRQWHWADEVSIEGDTVVARSDAVPEPVAVRYNYLEQTVGRLTDDTGLPAWPYRSDAW